MEYEYYEQALKKAWDTYNSQIDTIVEQARNQIAPILKDRNLQMWSGNGIFFIGSLKDGLVIDEVMKRWRKNHTNAGDIEDEEILRVLDILMVDIPGMNNDIGSLMEDIE